MIKKIRKSDEGFSLIEMLVAVLVTAIMMLAVGIFISTSNVVFKTVTISSKLQEESDSAKNFLSEIMIEAVNMCKSPDSASVKYWIFESMNNKDNADKTETDSLGNTKVNTDFYIFMLTKGDEDQYSLRYVKVESGDETHFRRNDFTDNNNKVNESIMTTYGLYEKYITNEKSSKYNVVAQCIEDFNIECVNKNFFNIDATYKYINTEYESNYSVNSRNKIADNWYK